jgi:electron transfer flavoprotein beta subunit
MNICTCIKQVPGTTKVEVDEKTGVLKRDGIESKMNPYDLYALETALRIKEQKGATLKVISMGPPQAAEIIKEAYMMGADDGLLLSDRKFAGADVLSTAYTLSQGIEAMGMPDLIICGKQTTDGDTAQVGPEIAEFLDIPHVTNVVSIHEVKEDAIVVSMDMPNSIEILEVAFPCLITVEKGINQPRLPSFLLKRKTKDKEIPMLCLKDFKDQDQKNMVLKDLLPRWSEFFHQRRNVKKMLGMGQG